MSIEWAERERRTNRLARIIATYIFKYSKPTPRQIYGLAGLAWITFDQYKEPQPYHKGRTVQMLGRALNEKFSPTDVADKVPQIVGDKSARELIVDGTGFTSPYNAYTKSSKYWVKEHYSVLLPMCKDAMQAKNINDRIALIKKIEKLPKIPRKGGGGPLPPANYLTPLFFMLDPEIKFPIINGREDVQELLKRGGVIDRGLVAQAEYMMSLYGQQGIGDAADVDCLEEPLMNFLGKSKSIISKPKHGKVMPIKDENDVKVIRHAVTKQQQQKHNKLTNNLIKKLYSYTLYEGEKSCMYDVLVKNYNDRGTDLLIEVKSSIEVPDVRLAVGQLFDYWFNLEQEDESQNYHLAVLLPNRPKDNVVEFLKWMDIGLLWFDDEELCTEDKWLKSIAIYLKSRTSS